MRAEFERPDECTPAAKARLTRLNVRNVVVSCQAAFRAKAHNADVQGGAPGNGGCR